MSDLDGEFDYLLNSIEGELPHLTGNEQHIVQAWIAKLSEPAASENQKKVRNDHAKAVLNMLPSRTGTENLALDMPPDGELQPMKDEGETGKKSPGNTSPGKTPGDRSPGGRSPGGRSPGGKSPGTKSPGMKEASPTKEPSPAKDDAQRSPARGYSPGRGASPAKSPASRKSPPLDHKEGPEEQGSSETHTPSPGASRQRRSTDEAEKQGGKDKPKYNYVRLPCTKRPGEGTGAIPKTRKTAPSMPEFFDSNRNEFEDFDEMAKVIARSKGQSFAEFVVAISRHTADFGQELRTAMKTETSTFREYVDHVLSQRIKDLTEVLNEEQNAELQKIKKDIDKWQLELSHCKKRIKDIIPDFDINLFKKDKNYLKRIFAIDFGPGIPQDESAKLWKDETRIRLSWYGEMINKLKRCNDRLAKELDDVIAKNLYLENQQKTNLQNYMQFLHSATAQCQALKRERDRLSSENAELLSEIQEYGI